MTTEQTRRHVLNEIAHPPPHRALQPPERVASWMRAMARFALGEIDERGRELKQADSDEVQS
jgi:hypothetical protein